MLLPRLLLPLLPPLLLLGALPPQAAAAAAPAAGLVPVYVDIHLPVLGAARDAARRANTFLNRRLKNGSGGAGIDFAGRDDPHVTRYLTAFTCPPHDGGAAGGGHDPPRPDETCVAQIADAINNVIYALETPGSACNITLSVPFAAGSYAMLNVTKDACLQRFSDTLVNATHALAEPNQTAPGWVHDLPEPERSEKLRYVKLYGSPNVFGQFAPHVSVGWSPDADAVAAAVAALPAAGDSWFRGERLAMGSVGAHGTVLTGDDFGVWNVSQRGDTGCRAVYAAEADCDADNVTDGGCVWCDIVDHPAFCTTTWNARSFEPPPQGQPFHCNF